MSETAESVRFDPLLERYEAFEEAILAYFPEAGIVFAIANQRHGLTATAEHEHAL